VHPAKLDTGAVFEVRVRRTGHEHRAGFVRGVAMRTVVIVLLDPARDAERGLVEVWYSLSTPPLLLTAMECSM